MAKIKTKTKAKTNKKGLKNFKVMEITLALSLPAITYNLVVIDILGTKILSVMLASPWAHLELASSVCPHRAG